MCALCRECGCLVASLSHAVFTVTTAVFPRSNGFAGRFGVRIVDPFSQRMNHAKALSRKVLKPNLCDFAPLREI